MKNAFLGELGSPSNFECGQNGVLPTSLESVANGSGQRSTAEGRGQGYSDVITIDQPPFIQ